ncbi:hypothetical protein [Ruegeria marina]|uniref:Uncharacterized protein n=1 Tax=Ruegeria marina TaxID=639004 RepID=A0A1G6XHP9_9RHOB|nr:hypothetical protein [Ruegeria marina]SDD77581.1 hypothetical protein SAMN04488239_11082 [Ruegeria marina]
MKTLKDLVLALINATLILVALCLFLAWQLMSTVDDITDRLTESIRIFAPVRDEVAGLRAEISGLRADIAAIGAQGVPMTRVEARLDAMGARLDDMHARMDELATLPDRLIDTAIETAADKFARSLSAVRGCEPIN